MRLANRTEKPLERKKSPAKKETPSAGNPQRILETDDESHSWHFQFERSVYIYTTARAHTR